MSETSPLLILDLYDGSGREFRAIPSQIQSIENNLSIANMDFEEFAESVDEDGVFRGFPRGKRGEQVSYNKSMTDQFKISSQVLALLEGTWTGEGRGRYPTINSFDYRETLIFTRRDENSLAYDQLTHHLEIVLERLK